MIEQFDKININPLPSKTWYWLHMNDTSIAWNPDITPCSMTADGSSVQKQIPENEQDWKAIQTGAGKAADLIFEDKRAAKAYLETDQQETVRLVIDGKDDSSAAGIFFLHAKENAQVTLIETFTKESEQPGGLAFRTLIHAEKNSKVRLVQIYMQGEGQTLLNDVGCDCEENAQFDVLQIFLGKGDLYHGIRTDLKGNGANVQEEIGYLGQKTQNIDMNLVVNHFGKKTNSLIRVDGTLKDAAKKTFRGSIDFKTGSSGSKGAETEDVLLLGDDVENKTIPLILCAEEDVEGNHGATIGELDEETLFYFETRGIDKDTAEDMMTKSKMEVLCRHIQDEQTEQLVEKQLAEVLEDDRA